MEYANPKRISPMAGMRSEERGSDFPGSWENQLPFRPYEGQTYYDLPVVKPSHYGWLISSYFFVGGLASASQFLATVIDIFGQEEDRPLVRAGRVAALVGALVSPPLLIADLWTPKRWFNMLRIYRHTSAMSIGSWSLTAFGTFSGLTFLGQVLEDLTGWRGGRWLSRLASIPAAAAGAIVSVYTGTLLAATATPLWSSAFPFVSSLFTSSAASSATAILSLYAGWKGLGEKTRQRLEWFSLIAGSVELLYASLIQHQWKKEEAAEPHQKSPVQSAWGIGGLGLAIFGPLAIHIWQTFRPRASRRASIGAAIATLLGSFTLRAVFIFVGPKSSQHPVDYFTLTQPKANGLTRRIEMKP